jgi:hypothetical protein
MKRGKSKLIIANTRQNARRDPGTGKTLIARALVLRLDVLMVFDDLEGRDDYPA